MPKYCSQCQSYLFNWLQLQWQRAKSYGKMQITFALCSIFGRVARHCAGRKQNWIYYCTSQAAANFRSYAKTSECDTQNAQNVCPAVAQDLISWIESVFEQGRGRAEAEGRLASIWITYLHKESSSVHKPALSIIKFSNNNEKGLKSWLKFSCL